MVGNTICNDRCVSVEKRIELLEIIPAEELKQSMIAIIKRDGLTFGEADLTHRITDFWFDNIHKK